MPEMDGRTLLLACAGDPALADIPIVVASGMPGDLKTLAEARPFAQLRKPVDLDKLAATLEQAVATRRAVLA
jgi:CheY-like chemotaxis protein